MKARTENRGADRIVAEKWAVWRESFRMARIMLKEQEPLTFEDTVAKEHYYSNVPILAMALHDQMLSGSAFIHQAPEKDQLERYDSAMAIVASMKAANDEVEEKGKAADAGPR
jgi:hypothetical protein